MMIWRTTTILMVLSGRVIDPAGEVELTRFLRWMTNDPTLHRFQLPRVADEVRGSLVEQFPELARVAIPQTAPCWECVALNIGTEFGTYRMVTALPSADHTRMNVVDEMKMRGLQVLYPNGRG